MLHFLHHYWAYLVISMFVLLLFKSIVGVLKQEKYSFRVDFRLALFTLIIFYIQLILGLLTYFNSDYFTGIKNGHFGEYMKDKLDRLIVIEHPVMMLIVLAVIQYGFNRMKKQIEDKKKFLDIIIFFTIAFFLIILRIPWSKF